MKLALIHKQIGGGGGLEKYLVGFAQQLLAAGHEVHLVTQQAEMGEAEAAGLTIHQVPKLPGLRSARLLKFCSDSRAAAEKIGADAVIGFGQTVDQDIHRAGGGCHRVYSRMLPALKRLSPKNRVELSLEKQLYTSGRTRHFVVNSSKVADELAAEYGVDRERISVVHTPVDAERFHPAPPNSKRDPDELPVFLFVSMDHKRKGLDALLDVWPKVGAELRIVGAPLSRAQAERIGFAPRVTFLGHSDDLAGEFRGADFFIHPTLYDACANTVLQSMASGLPSIVSARDGAVEFIEDGVNGFILNDPEDRAEILELVNRVLALSPAKLATLGAKAREQVAGQTWDRHINEWIALIEQLLAPGSICA